ncbi:MAG: DUF6439 family protein [Cyanobacteria bacterium]|nr:DUF6439 family protein [Cyanobacteriota bacterium]MDA1245834.1 DUF6439 family protein [Cyanobacteriota bacterium]
MCPVQTPLSKSKRCWPEGSLEVAVVLQRQLAISDRDWHAFKAQRPRRGAEQLAAALVLLLRADDPGASQSTDARQQAIELVENGLSWLKADLSDPGCPSHRPTPAETFTAD